MSDTLWPGVDLVRSAHVTFARPGPSAKRQIPKVKVTGGTFTWSWIGNSTKGCSFLGGPVSAPLRLEDASYLNFDVTKAAEGIITYKANGVFTDGPRVRVKQSCDGKSFDFNTDAEGTWLYAPGNQEFRVTGTVISETWSDRAHTTNTWTLTRVK